jgi:hypothetical protein
MRQRLHIASKLQVQLKDARQLGSLAMPGCIEAAPITHNLNSGSMRLRGKRSSNKLTTALWTKRDA